MKADVEPTSAPGAADSATLLTPLAQKPGAGAASLSTAAKTWIRQMPVASATDSPCSQRPCSPPYGAAGSPQDGIGVMGSHEPAANMRNCDPVGEIST